MSALAVGFFTTEPPGKPQFYSLLNVPRGLPVPLLRIIDVYSQGKSDENL